MAEIGVISARITADDRDFQRAFQRARGGIKDLSRRFKAAAGTAAKYSAAVGTAAAVIGTKLVAAQTRAIQSTNRLVEISGVQARTIEALRIQATKYGVSQERVNDAVVDFSERLGEARSGTGEAVDGFKALEKASGRNIDLGQNVNDVWRDFVAAMGQVSDSSTRASIAAQVGGDALRDMLPVLAEGKGAFRDAAEAADEMGLAFTRIEGQQVQNAAAAFGNARLAIQGVARTATVELAPAIEAISNRFVDAARENNGFRDQILGSFEAIAVGGAKVQNAIKGLQIAWEAVKFAFEGVRLAINTGLRNIAKLVRETINTQINSINTLIEAWNKLGIAEQETIKTLKAGNLEQTFQSQAQAATKSIDEIKQRMHELAMEGANPEQVRKFFQTLREESRKAAEETAGGGRREGGQGGEGENSRVELERKKEQERLEVLRESLMTERELQMKHFETSREQLRAALEKDMITKKEFKELERQLEQQHQSKLTQIAEKGASEREKFSNSSMISQADTVATQFKRMTQNVSAENKRMFEIQKAASIASAIVNTYQGVTQALAAYPPPVSFAMAAAQAAFGFAKVSQIKSQSFSGGGSGGGGAGGGGGGQASAQAAQQAGGGGQGGGGGGPTREATFNISGDVFGQRQIEQIAEGLNEFAGDNGDLRVNVRKAT